MYKGANNNLASQIESFRIPLPINVVNYQDLSQELLLVLRGTLSQRELSKKLGYSFNQIGKWESGVTLIKWSDFLKLAELLKLPIEKSFRTLFPSSTEKFNYKNSLIMLDRNLLLRSNIEFTGHKQITKWLNGKTAPSFEMILRAFDTRPSMLLGWLSYFIDCRQLESIHEQQELFYARINAVLKDPNCVYVNAALQLRPYQELREHDEKLLAQHSACSITQLRNTLKLMVDSLIIQFDGIKYLACPFDFSFSALPLAKLRPLTKHTTQLAATRYPLEPARIDPEKTKTHSFSSVRVAAMSPTASRRISDLIIQFHNQVGEIIKEDHLPKENVQILIMHSFATNI